ncbi:MAG TPA: hypothetical protein VN655_11940 [Pseudolabrys sp.]|jgi:hypothetical protein|nr:hypothetical protein [Pseudolabrys sp.]
MLDKIDQHARDCYVRAAECRERAEATDDPDMRDFWLGEEERWVRLAGSDSLSSRISGYLGTSKDTFSPEAEDGIAALVDVFNRVCVELNLDPGDEEFPRKVARTLIQAALAGESDPAVLHRCAVEAVSH